MSVNLHHRSAILDTSVLIVLYHLNLLKYLNLFYTKVRIPREVEREFLTKHFDQKERSARFDFLMDFYKTNKMWFLPCHEYNSDIVEIYLTEPNIDRGEAEAFAQNQALGNVHEILLDEKEARHYARSKNIHHHGVLFILANLDVKYKACKYFHAVEKVRNECATRFSDSVVEQVYKTIKMTT